MLRCARQLTIAMISLVLVLIVITGAILPILLIKSRPTYGKSCELYIVRLKIY